MREPDTDHDATQRWGTRQGADVVPGKKDPLGGRVVRARYRDWMGGTRHRVGIVVDAVDCGWISVTVRRTRDGSPSVCAVQSEARVAAEHWTAGVGMDGRRGVAAQRASLAGTICSVAEQVVREMEGIGVSVTPGMEALRGLVAQALCMRLDIGSGDAQGLVMANESIVSEGRIEGVEPIVIARRIDEASLSREAR